MSLEKLSLVQNKLTLTLSIRFHSGRSIYCVAEQTVTRHSVADHARNDWTWVEDNNKIETAEYSTTGRWAKVKEEKEVKVCLGKLT